MAFVLGKMVGVTRIELATAAMSTRAASANVLIFRASEQCPTKTQFDNGSGSPETGRTFQVQIARWALQCDCIESSAFSQFCGIFRTEEMGC
jgi:hypothetical protein